MMEYALYQGFMAANERHVRGDYFKTIRVIYESECGFDGITDPYLMKNLLNWITGI